MVRQLVYHRSGWLGVFMLVLAASISGQQLLKGANASRAELVSVTAELVISVTYLAALPIYHSIINEQEKRSKLEHGALMSAVWQRDLTAFKTALEARKHLAIDAPLMYHVFLFSIDRRLEDMALEVVNAGMPLLLNKQLHPELRGAIQRHADYHHDRPTPELVAGIMAVASRADLRTQRHWRKVSMTLLPISQTYPPSRISSRNALAERIQNDPQIGFAASLSGCA